MKTMMQIYEYILDKPISFMYIGVMKDLHEKKHKNFSNYPVVSSPVEVTKAAGFLRLTQIVNGKKSIQFLSKLL